MFIIALLQTTLTQTFMENVFFNKDWKSYRKLSDLDIGVMQGTRVVVTSMPAYNNTSSTQCSQPTVALSQIATFNTHGPPHFCDIMPFWLCDRSLLQNSPQRGLKRSAHWGRTVPVKGVLMSLTVLQSLTPNQTHLNKLIRVFRITKTRQVRFFQGWS